MAEEGKRLKVPKKHVAGQPGSADHTAQNGQPGKQVQPRSGPAATEGGRSEEELARPQGEHSAPHFGPKPEEDRKEEPGTGPASGSEELDPREALLKRREDELAKKHELVSTSIEAIDARGEELLQRELKLKSAEEELAKLRKELDSMHDELGARQERLREETAKAEQQGKKVEELATELRRREEELRRSESESSSKAEKMGRTRRELDELESRLKESSERLREREEELRALEQHFGSIEEEIGLCPHCSAINEFEHLARRTAELKEKGEDTEELSVEIKAARRALLAGDYEGASGSARRAAELLRKRQLERARREATACITASESLVRMLKESKADVSALEARLEAAWADFKCDRTEQALSAAEEVRHQALALEQERFSAMDELVACNSVLAAIKRSGVNMNVHGAEQKHAEAEKAMASGDFKKARALAAETGMLASEAAQSQDVATAMSQIKLAEETLDETRALGLDISEWERMVNRSRDFLKKLDFKSAEETARWARQKARDAGRQYRQALMALDRSGSVLSTYKDTGLVIRKAEDIQDEAKRRLKEGDSDTALNLSRKAEKMVREIAERHKGAQAALGKAMATVRRERKAGKDVAKGERLYDLAVHQLELGEYANAMKLATKAADSLTSASVALLELCPTCGEVIPDNIPECPACSEKRRLKEEAEGAAKTVQRSRPGAKGGRKYACPYCSELFEITSAARPVTIYCPWCKSAVSVLE